MEGQGEEMCLWSPVIVNRIPMWCLPPAGSWNREGGQPGAQDALILAPSRLEEAHLAASSGLGET